MAVVEQGDGFPVAVLNAYCVPAAAYERLMEKLEDLELAQFVRERENQPEVDVSWLQKRTNNYH